jgi:hypothetical protein
MTTLADWRRYENIGLEPSLDLDALWLNWTDKRISDLDAKGAICALGLERTIEGASTLTMTLRDPAGRIFSQQAGRLRALSGVALAPAASGRALEVALDGVTFSLVKVAYSHAATELVATFEDRVVYRLRRRRGARHDDRAHCTRAQFVLSLLREVAGRADYRFVCPELSERQPIDRPKARRLLAVSQLAAKGSDSDEPAASEGGFAPSARLTVKGKQATPAQRRRMAAILGEARRQGASEAVQAACIACPTQESRMGEDARSTGNDDSGLFQQGRNWIDAADAMDPVLATRAFLTGAVNGGGARGWRQIHGSLVRLPGGFEAAIKRVQVSVGGYGQWRAESQHTVEAYGGGEGKAAQGATNRWQTRRYQFARNSDEDSWTAIQRLASEVGWRCFVVGRSVYYMSERQLYERQPGYEVTPDDPAVLDLSYEIDWGRPVSEASLQVALDRWGTPPGSVVVLSGWGPPDGRWLVGAVSRDWFSPSATITLTQPGKEQLEPVGERSDRAARGSGSQATSVDRGSKAQRAYDAARAISQHAYPYVWGGGHARAGTPDGGTGRDRGPGYDCSGSVCAALAAAGLGYRIGGPVDTSGAMAAGWGEPGEGRQLTVWANASHVFIQWHGLGARRFDTSAHGDSSGRGARQRSTERETAGFTARRWPGV